MEAAAIEQFFASLKSIQLLHEPLAEQTSDNLAKDTTLLRQLAQSSSTAILRVWENPRSLIVTRRETRLPHYARACEQMAFDGWPVFVRDSGGTAVPHEPGVIHLSLIYRQPAVLPYNLDLAYQALCEPIRRAMEAMGVAAVYGNVEGAYCDGRYNLVVNNRKITGTAQRLIPMPAGGQAILAQAMVNVATDPVIGTQVVNQFYELAGDERRYDPAASTSLHLELPHIAPRTLVSRYRNELLRAVQSLTHTHRPT